MHKKELILWPANQYLQILKWAGRQTMTLAEAVDQRSRSATDAAARLISRRALGEYLSANRADHEKQSIEREMFERQREYKIVDLCAHRWLRISLNQAHDADDRAIATVETHIGDLNEKMKDCGLGDATRERAVSILQDKVTDPSFSTQLIPFERSEI